MEFNRCGFKVDGNDGISRVYIYLQVLLMQPRGRMREHVRGGPADIAANGLGASDKVLGMMCITRIVTTALFAARYLVVVCNSMLIVCTHTERGP